MMKKLNKDLYNEIISFIGENPRNTTSIFLLKQEICDVFIEDSIANFIECNKSGVFTLLLTTPENKHYNTPLRIGSLNYGDIINKYREYNKYN